MNKKILNLIILLVVASLIVHTMNKRCAKKDVQTVEQIPAVERTLAIIKPDTVAAGHVDDIVKIIKDNNFTILREEKITLTRDQAERFYGIHKGKPFFDELVDMMTSGPIIVLALEKVDAIKAWRELMGNTNPAKAVPGTIRNLYGTSIGSNATHGSDAPETAAQELAFFFPYL